MPRVLHLFNVFGALTERAMLDYTLGLARAGWDLTVGYETLAPEAPATPIRLVRLDRVAVETPSNVPGQMAGLLQPRDPAMAALLDEGFDLVHGHFGPRILQGAPWLARGVPMVVSVYGYDTGRLLRDPCWAERYQWAAAHGATFVALAQRQFDRLAALGLPPERLRMIRLGIHLASHHYAPTPAPASPRFVFIGRLVEKKGAEDAIRAIGLLGHGTLDVIGGGPLETTLRALAAQLGLQDRVRFVGTVPFAELFHRLEGATALVQPSVTAADGDAEGAPMVLMHAQASGVPCITTDHSGNPEVLPPEGNRFVVPERDPVALAAAMRAMIGLPPAARLALQVAGRRWIEERYDLAATVSQYDQLYRELLR